MIFRVVQVLLVSAALFTINGCSQINIKPPAVSVPTTSVLATKEQLWKKRQQVLVRDSSWNLKSKIALRFRQDHWSFGMDWAQKSAQQYLMQINNPITGGVLAKLSRNSAGVSLVANDGKTYRDTNEERLLQRQAGISLPIKGMQYWMRGLASPQYKMDKVVLDALGRPQSLIQAGWKVEYSRYTSNKYNAMPRKVVITRNKDNVYLKMIAKQWQGI